MKKPRHYVTLTLMTTSMVLLIALQALWLRNSYERAAEDLRNETGRLLRETVVALRDSMLLKNIEALPPDGAGNVSYSRRTDTTFMFMAEGGPQKRPDGQVQVFISSTTGEDSARQMLRSVASKISEGRMRTNSRFTIRLRDDSLNLDSIQVSFQRQLHQNGIPVTAEVARRGGPPQFPPVEHGPVRLRQMMDTAPDADEPNRLSLFGPALRTQSVRVDPFFRYVATLHPVRPLLLREITPQILFSVFVTLLTVGSFAVMYRNIRSQQRLMALKNDFISNITHELKTPIATVSVALEALKNFKGMDNPRLTAEYLDIAQLELNRLSILTEKVLTTSLFDENGVTLDVTPVDMEETVSTVVNSMKLVTEKANATLTFEKEGQDFVVSGSAIHLTNVAYNLLDNALKYSPGKPEVLVRLKDEDSTVILSVRDNGIGIPAEFQSKIFERFFRMPTGDIHNTKGYGLGLSYVDQVIRQHGGTIAVVSAPDQGSTFTIVLPKKASNG